MRVNGPPMGPGQLGWLDMGLQALEQTPLNEGDKANIVLLVSVYVLGQTRSTVDVTAACEAGAEHDGTDLEEDFALTPTKGWTRTSPSGSSANWTACRPESRLAPEVAHIPLGG